MELPFIPPEQVEAPNIYLYDTNHPITIILVRIVIIVILAAFLFSVLRMLKKYRNPEDKPAEPADDLDPEDHLSPEDWPCIAEPPFPEDPDFQPPEPPENTH